MSPAFHFVERGAANNAGLAARGVDVMSWMSDEARRVVAPFPSGFG